MKNSTLALLLAAILSFALPTFAGPITTTGNISNVIVYRGQALVTRLIDLDLPQGNSEVIVQSLPSNTLVESLFAQASPNITVLSIRYREQQPKEDEREEVKQLDANIANLSKELNHTERDIAHGGNLWARYDPYWSAGLKAATPDVNRSSLQFEPIEQLTGYLEQKFTQLHKHALEMEDHRDEMRKDLEALRKKRAELTAGSGKIMREAVLYLNKVDTNKAKLELNYMVNGANWLPQYNLRANSTAGTVLIEHNAIIHQSSGEDWTNIAMTLSTAQPTLVAAPPSIEPMTINIAPPPAGPVFQKISKDEIAMTQQSLAEQPQYIDRTDNYQGLLKSRREEAKKGKDSQFALNTLATSNQMMEIMADAEKAKEIRRQTVQVARTEGVSVSYAIQGKLTLPSRSDQQLVTIAAVTTKVAFTHIATPLLTDYVYIQGELTNDTNTIFLPGQAAMSRDNEFVGNGSMELVTAGEKFTMGFGIDSQVQVRRELEDKKTDIGWRTRNDNSLYRIAISNYRSTPVTLQLFDRIPYTENPDVRIELLNPSISLSKDADYLRTARKKGILRWDLKLAPNTIDDKATIVTYNVAMEYPRDMQIKSGK
jgi:hypothetical protein